MKTWTKGNVGNGARPAFWPKYRKTHLTPAIYVGGPFKVRTKEGELECPDGYIAVDSEGWPYPISRADFEAMYEMAVDGDGRPVAS